MNATTAAAQPARQPAGAGPPGASIPFDSISTPGAYLCHWSGHLLRLPARAIAADSHINIVGPEPLFVTKISDDPTISLARARQVAERLGLPTSF